MINPAYLTFIGSIGAVLFGGLFAYWQSRPKSQIDKFTALTKAYAELSDDYREDNDRLRQEVIQLTAELKTVSGQLAAALVTIKELQEQILELQKVIKGMHPAP